MPPTLKDFTARLEEKRDRERQQEAAKVVHLKQAAVKATQLMQHEGWDYFLSVLQAELDKSRTEEMEWLLKVGAALLDHDIKYAQLNYNIWKSRATTLEEVIALPSQMRGQAAQNRPAGNPAHNAEES